MTLIEDSTRHIPSDLLKTVAEGGLEKIGEAIQILINAAMKAERDSYLGAAPYERTGSRKGHANGFKGKKVKTRVGELEFNIPQTRDGGFYPSALEKGLRSERALRAAVAEMYIHGVSTRKVANILEELGEVTLSSTSVSNATKDLDELLEQWRNRPLGEYRYLYLDALYERVREGGSIIDNSILLAVGVMPSGHREVLGVSIATSEAEIHWRTFLIALHARGLRGVTLITSDDHAGLRAALRAVFPSIKWQRCQFHFQQNAQQYVPKQDMKTDVSDDIRSIFDAANRTEADRLTQLTVQKYSKSAPKLSKWLEENVIEALTVFDYPIEQRRRLRTSNVIERLNREIKRRTRVVAIFPNASSCLRLITAVAMEESDKWITRDTPYLPPACS